MFNLSQIKDFLQTRQTPAMAWVSCRTLMMYGIILTIFATCDKIFEKKTRFRSLYAREVHSLRDKDISSGIIGEYRNIRSTSNCLNLCLNVQMCLSFQFNNIEGLCRLCNNNFSNSAISHSGNRYFLALKDACEDGYIYHRKLGLCWKPYSIKANYSVALQTCQNDRGRLLRISSPEIWEYLKQMLAEYSMSLFWVQGATNGTHVINDDGSVADLMTIALEESVEMEPNSRFIIAREQDFQWLSVSPGFQNGFLCQVAARTNV